MERILYHGSDKIIERPEYGKGNVHNDYGLGFYCCSNRELAKEWASRKGGVGYVNRYALRDDNLRILDLTKPPYDDVLNWVALLMHNRELGANVRENYPRELKYLEEKYLIDASRFDVIIGYRADDSYFQFPLSFIRSEITLDSLKEIFKAGNLGKQYVLISPKAFVLIKFLDYGEVSPSMREDYYKRKHGADKVYTELLIKDRYSDGIRMRDLIKGYE